MAMVINSVETLCMTRTNTSTRSLRDLHLRRAMTCEHIFCLAPTSLTHVSVRDVNHVFLFILLFIAVVHIRTCLPLTIHMRLTHTIELSLHRPICVEHIRTKKRKTKKWEKSKCRQRQFCRAYSGGCQMGAKRKYERRRFARLKINEI